MSDSSSSGKLARPLSIDRAPVERDLNALMARLSVNGITTRYWRLEQDLVGCQESGIGATGLLRQKLDRVDTRRALAAVERSGIAVSSLSWVGGFTGVNERPYDEAVADGLRAIELAWELGTETIVVYGGGLKNHIRSHADRTVREGLLALADAAAGRGVTLAVQPMVSDVARRWSFLTSLDDALHLIDRCDHPAIGLSFDAFHSWREPDVLERIDEIAELTALVRLNDSDPIPCDSGERRLPGEGSAPLGDLLTGFEDAGYDGYYEMTLASWDLWRWNYMELLMECRSRFGDLIGLPA